MTGPARAGVLIYAKDLNRLSRFYQTLLSMRVLKTSDELRVIASEDSQLLIHAIPPHIAATIAIATPSGDYSALLMIGAGANGTQANQAITLTFSDGSTATWTQTFTDWRNNNGSNNNPPPTPQQLAATGEALVAQTNVVNSLGNNQMKENAFVYGYSYDLPAGKTLVSITLPNNQNVGILGIALV